MAAVGKAAGHPSSSLQIGRMCQLERKWAGGDLGWDTCSSISTAAAPSALQQDELGTGLSISQGAW